MTSLLSHSSSYRVSGADQNLRIGSVVVASVEKLYSELIFIRNVTQNLRLSRILQALS